VIRYDQRGTGASDWMPAWRRAHPYALVDMAADATAALDALRVERAHVIGLSLGGFVAQEIAIGHPGRVASLTLMSTAADPTDTSLPGPRFGRMLRAGLAGIPLLRYRLLGGERNLVKEVVAKTIIGIGYENLDIEETAELVLYDLRYRRGINFRAIGQHQAAVAATRSRYELLGGLRVPTLVIHGTADDFLPIEHARKLVELIPGARSLWLKGVGHLFPYPDMPAVTQTIVSHLDGAR
jgi:pimeloyl-ACP methyl ester carboxylesterase